MTHYQRAFKKNLKFLSLDVVESTSANLFLSRDEKAFICIAGTGKS